MSLSGGWEYRNTVLGLCMVAFFATMVARLAISPVVPLIVRDFGVSNALVGLALTGMWMAYAASQFPSGLITDRIGEKQVILGAVGGTAAGSLLLAISPVFGAFALATVFIGFAAGLHYTPATVLLSRLYDNVSTAFGVHSLGSPIAGVTAPVLAVWIGTQFGWRAGVAIGTLFAVPVFVLVVWRIQPTPPTNPASSLADQLNVNTLGELLFRPRVAFTSLIMIAGTFVWQGLASFLPTFLVAYHDLSPTVASVLFSLYFVVHGSSMIGMGVVADRHSRDLVIGVCYLAAFLGFVAFVTTTALWLIVLGVGLLGVGLSSYPAQLSRLLDGFSDSESGRGLGIVRTVTGIIGASGSVVVGLVADVVSWGVAFWVLGAVSLSVVVLLVWAQVSNRSF